MLKSSIMFHHFYDDFHPKGQGAISAQSLRDLILKIGVNKFAPPEYFINAAEKYDSPAKCDLKYVSLTFDDSLMCQFDVALPVLDEFGLKAFWFVNTSPQLGDTSRSLEIYRYFRTTCFEDIVEFYEIFKSTCFEMFGDEMVKLMSFFNSNEYLKHSPFYSFEDKEFRYIRDRILGDQKYHECMSILMNSKNFDITNASKKLWIGFEELVKLCSAGHLIGLHSHTHPTLMENLSKMRQYEEYKNNYSYIVKATGVSPLAMSHPCNSYGIETLDILNSIGVKVGFRADEAVQVEDCSWLELPRVDHANLI